MTPADAYLRLALVPGLGPITAEHLLAEADDPAEIFTWSMARLTAIDGIGPERARRLCDPRGDEALAAERALCHANGIRLITRADAEYPRALTRLPDPPLALWLRGELKPADQLSLAVVGPRRPSPYGHRTAQRLSSQLARLGVCLVSGLARGIDTVAHEAALAAPEGRTIAVIGSGLGKLYPEENRGLAERIVADRGAVLSEFPFNLPPSPGTFPRRNRIVAGLALATLVIEAGGTSGALITARISNELGKPVLVVPGPIDQPECQGSNQLIRDGATLVASVEHLLEEVEPLMTLARGAATIDGKPPPSPRAEALTGREKQLYTLLDDQARTIDDLVRATTFQPSIISATLLSLELKRLARKQPDGFVRAT